MKAWQIWFKEAVAGQEMGISKILTLIERGEENADLLKKIYQAGSQIYTLAITGSAGAGKSTLVRHLAPALAQGQNLGIVAMDPRSPLSGGAFLGDRIRMGEMARHPRIFFRSFAPKGPPFSGYLTAKIMAHTLGACGFGCVLIETFGAGQAEWPLQHLADTALVVLSPESGDEIQMMKRGLVEWADIFVVNKSDRPGAKALEAALQREIQARRPADGWKPPVLSTVASTGKGIEDLLSAVEKHQQFLKITGRLENERTEHQNMECMLWALSAIWHRFEQNLKNSKRDQNPYLKARQMLKKIF